MKGVVSDLAARIHSPSLFSVGGRLVNGILTGSSKETPMDLKGETFNRRAEHYYMETLRVKHMEQGLSVLEELFAQLEIQALSRDTACREALCAILGEAPLTDFIDTVRYPFLDGSLSRDKLLQFIHLIILYIDRETRQ